jgi:hypothetical protein
MMTKLAPIPDPRTTKYDPTMNMSRLHLHWMMTLFLAACGDTEGPGGSGAGGGVVEEPTCENCAVECDAFGLCLATCESGSDCEVSCSGLALCGVDCTDTNTCATSCTGDADCLSVDCAGANNCTVDCADTAFCSVDCTDANNCDHVTCREDAECLLVCTGANNCEFETCENPTSCADDVIACNRECPSCGDGLCEAPLEFVEECPVDCG